MTENRLGQFFDKAATYLSNAWRGTHAPENILTKTRKRIDFAMVATGTFGMAEGVILKSPMLFAASAADLGVGLADLSYAGQQMHDRDLGPR